MFNTRSSRGARKTCGFTLVELLVVIAIIGILVAMLLPALSAAREAGRNAQCKNNLKQLGVAVLAHENAQEFFPTGGWGTYWVGDPDRGYGKQQPGGWIYNILPHSEMTALHDLGRNGTASAKQSAILQMVSTPFSLTSCPTRHRDMLYQVPATTKIIAYNGGSQINVPVGGIKVARTDYAVNCGDQSPKTITKYRSPYNSGNQYSTGPAAGADATLNGSLSPNAATAQANYFGTRLTDNLQVYTGICFERSTVRKDDVRDGLSQTILAGEKYLGPDNYGMGTPGADSENEYVGFDKDIGRTTYRPPMQDRVGVSDTLAFGSAHPNAANFVLCDGSTLSISYQVDPNTFRMLGTRDEGVPVDMSKL